MKRTRCMCMLLSILLLLPLFLIGCRDTGDPGTDLMEGITPVAAVERKTDDAFAEAITAFGLELFRGQFKDGENVLLSPLSVYIALSMTAGGARSETLREMEDVLGLSAEELHQYLKTYTDNLPSTEKSRLSIANSVWFRDDERLKIAEEFLALNGGYYGAEARKVPFNQETVKAVNHWVKEKTEGMIPRLVDENSFSEYTMLCLINAVVFDAKWREPYEDWQVSNKKFHSSAGEEDAEMLCEWGSSFMETDNATGFLKYYDNSRYALMTILPKEGVDFSEYASHFDEAEYRALLASGIGSGLRYDVYTELPKFSCEFSADLAESLALMGMPTAFADNGTADFSGMLAPDSSVKDLYISGVIHKTFIELTEAGTRAAAVTAVIMAECTSCEPAVKEKREVILDRPFLYAIVDTQTNVPLFFGAVNSIG